VRVEAAVEVVLERRRLGKRSPPSLVGELTIDEAYLVQGRVAERLMSEGAQQTGWKVGGNSPRFRNTYDNAPPMRGYLFQKEAFKSGDSIDYAALTVLPRMESEICFKFNTRLAGPKVGREEVAGAVSTISPAFEIPCVIEAGTLDLVAAGKLDLPMCIADNSNTFLHVLGPENAWLPTPPNLEEIFVEERCNGRISQQGRARDFIDDQLESIAWLARHLDAYGLAIESGQYVLSGNCCSLATKAQQGDLWESTFSGLGKVSIDFR
jgi:2-keto-4-pentenoate hydratase